MHSPRTSRRPSCPNFASILPNKSESEFLKELLTFHSTHRTPFSHVPTLFGKRVSLLNLFRAVIRRGGSRKVSETRCWPAVVADLDLPSACTNAGLAVKRIYQRYLEPYEKTQTSDLLNESNGYRRTDDVVPGRGLADSASSLVELLGSSGDSRDTELRYRLGSRISGAGLSYLDPIPMSYMHSLHVIPNHLRKACQMSEDLAQHGELSALVKALHSGLPNEVDLALNTLLILTKTLLDFHLERINNLLDLVLASVGIFDDGPLSYFLLHDDWKRQSNRNFLRFWVENVKSPTGRRFLHSDVFTRKEFDLEVNLTPEGDITDTLFNTGDHLNQADLEGHRVYLVAMVLRNLGMDKHNARSLTASPQALRFLFLCSNAEHSFLRTMGQETLAGLAYPLGDTTHPSLVEATLTFVNECVVSEDRMSRIRGSEMLVRLCHVAANAPVLTTGMQDLSLTTLISALLVRDVHSLVLSLDALYGLSALGEEMCERLVKLGCAREGQCLTGLLLVLLTMEAHTLGVEALYNVKIVQWMEPDAPHPPPHSAPYPTQHPQPYQQHRLPPQGPNVAPPSQGHCQPISHVQQPHPLASPSRAQPYPAASPSRAQPYPVASPSRAQPYPAASPIPVQPPVPHKRGGKRIHHPASLSPTARSHLIQHLQRHQMKEQSQVSQQRLPLPPPPTPPPPTPTQSIPPVVSPSPISPLQISISSHEEKRPTETTPPIVAKEEAVFKIPQPIDAPSLSICTTTASPGVTGPADKRSAAVAWLRRHCSPHPECSVFRAGLYADYQKEVSLTLGPQEFHLLVKELFSEVGQLKVHSDSGALEVHYHRLRRIDTPTSVSPCLTSPSVSTPTSNTETVSPSSIARIVNGLSHTESVSPPKESDAAPNDSSETIVNGLSHTQSVSPPKESASAPNDSSETIVNGLSHNESVSPPKESPSAPNDSSETIVNGSSENESVSPPNNSTPTRRTSPKRHQPPSSQPERLTRSQAILRRKAEEAAALAACPPKRKRRSPPVLESNKTYHLRHQNGVSKSLLSPINGIRKELIPTRSVTNGLRLSLRKSSANSKYTAAFVCNGKQERSATLPSEALPVEPPKEKRSSGRPPASSTTLPSDQPKQKRSPGRPPALSTLLGDQPKQRRSPGRPPSPHKRSPGRPPSPNKRSPGRRHGSKKKSALFTVKKGSCRRGNQFGAPKNGSLTPDGRSSAMSPTLAYLCEWEGCAACFAETKQVYPHVYNKHLRQLTTDPEGRLKSGIQYNCAWSSCIQGNLPRAPFSLANHIRENHCTNDALQNSLTKRRKAALAGRLSGTSMETGEKENDRSTNDEPVAVPVCETAWSTYQRALRVFHAGPQEGPLPFSMTDVGGWREGPVTKHLRVTAALILKNLARHSPLVARKLLGHEDLLCTIAMSPMNSSRPISQCLFDLQKALQEDRHLTNDT